jgi:hypothetical protein
MVARPPIVREETQRQKANVVTYVPPAKNGEKETSLMYAGETGVVNNVTAYL